MTTSEKAWVTGHLAVPRLYHLGGEFHFHPVVQRKKLRPREFFGLRPGRWDRECVGPTWTAWFPGLPS